ncbi:MAG: hypothetical protein R3344_06475, partial [Acidobacteriota bacterium]|nr:hypothetical protein [Acidobacteriota bacterium]
MIAFKTRQELLEWQDVHPTLVEIVEDLDDLWWSRGGLRILVVTEVYRSRAETIAAYEAAERTPPRISVHEVKPVRGVDCSVRIPRGLG